MNIHSLTQQTHTHPHPMPGPWLCVFPQGTVHGDPTGEEVAKNLGKRF